MASPIQFYFDQHFPHAVANGLRQRGADVLTAQDVGRCGFADADQLQYAAQENRVLVTFDPDYLALNASGVQHTGIAWCEATKYSTGQLIQALLLVHRVLTPAEMCNHVEYL